jgi:hypothetical protein
MKKAIVAAMFCCVQFAGAALAADCPGGPPESAVLGYAEAMKAKNFEAAYDFVTDTMTDGRPREEWANLQRKMFEFGGVSIGKIDVRKGVPDPAPGGGCPVSAKVPNVLNAVDVLNNQGSTEFEVYTVLLKDGKWRIDSQETLFDEPKIREWFPDDEIPEFKETAPR